MESENEDLEDLVGRLKKETEAKNEEIKWLKTLVSHRENQIRHKAFAPSEKKSDIPKIAFISTICLVVVAAGFAAYSLFFNDKDTQRSANTDSPVNLADRAAAFTDSAELANARDLEKIKNNKIAIDSMMRVKSLENDPGYLNDSEPAGSNLRDQQPARSAQNTDAVARADEPETEVKRNPEPVKKPEPVRKPVIAEALKKKPEPKPIVKRKPAVKEAKPNEEVEEDPPVITKDKYSLAVNKAYFYNKPDVAARAPAVLLNTGNMELTAIEEINGFVRVSFFNTQGTITEGWLRLQDLTKIN